MNGRKSRQGARNGRKRGRKLGGMKVSVDAGIKKGRANWREAGGWGGEEEGGGGQEAERGRLKVGEMGRRKRDRRWRE